MKNIIIILLTFLLATSALFNFYFFSKKTELVSTIEDKKENKINFEKYSDVSQYIFNLDSKYRETEQYSACSVSALDQCGYIFFRKENNYDCGAFLLDESKKRCKESSIILQAKENLDYNMCENSSNKEDCVFEVVLEESIKKNDLEICQTKLTDDKLKICRDIVFNYMAFNKKKDDCEKISDEFDRNYCIAGLIEKDFSEQETETVLAEPVR